MQTILDIGGEGRLDERNTLSAQPDHPVWGQAAWFTVNIESSKHPDIVADAVTLSGIRDTGANGIYSSHTIEHIAPDSSHEMFQNWLRVLKPGGRVEIRCPDAEWTWKEYFAGRLPEVLITELLLGIRTGQYEVHRNLWWASKLIDELGAAGFVRARRIDYGFDQPYLDFWPYDGKYSEQHGFKVIDLLVEAYKPDLNPAAMPPNTRVIGSSTTQRSTVDERAVRWVPYRFRNLARRLRQLRQRKAARNILRSVLVSEQPASQRAVNS